MVSKARLTALLGASTRDRRQRGMPPAIFSASGESWSAGKTRETRLERSASAASIIRPVRIMSIAFDLPTARVRRWVPPAPGKTPRLISGWPNFAVSAARMKSHIIASSQPPPSAKPATAAMTGFRTRTRSPSRADEVAQQRLGEGPVLHLLDVGAGGERLLGAGQHDRADRRVGVERQERCVEVLDQRVAQRVQRLRPVEPDQADAAVGFDDDVGVGHGAFHRNVFHDA